MLSAPAHMARFVFASAAFLSKHPPGVARDQAISGCYLVIASVGFCHRERRILSKHPPGVARNVATSGCYLVIARYEAISVFAASNQKREIASQARLYLSSRAERGDLACRIRPCHREGCGDLDCSGLANREKRDCFAGSPLSVIASAGFCHRERSVAISPVDSAPVIASAGFCHREVRGELGFRRQQTKKERLLRRLASICHREERSDLAFVMKITRNERLPRCARNDNTPVIARDLASSVARGWRTDKREIAALRSL